MSATHKFKLLSGPSCVVRELTGKEQETLTKKRGSMIDAYNQVLVDILVSVGSVTQIDLPFVEGMLSEDKRLILAEARQFSMGFEEMYVYKYEYTSEKTGLKTEHEVEIDLHEGFPQKPYPFQAEEYKDIDKTVTLTLPRSGYKVEWTLLDGVKEKAASAVYTEKNISSHSPIAMRSPVRIIEEAGDTPKRINLDLNRLGLFDIEFLRKAMKEAEGKVDTEIAFEHPESEFKIGAAKTVTVDLISTMSFFFPSGTI